MSKVELIKLLISSEGIPANVLLSIQEESDKAEYNFIRDKYENIYSIYKIRYRAKKESNSIIPNGLKELIKKLEKTRVKYIKVHRLTFKDKMVVFFTDDQIKILLGMIY